MGHHSLPEAREKLADLIDRALAGEKVVILRDGQPVVEIKAVEKPAERPSSEAMLAWLRARRLGRGSGDEDVATTVRAMRDEEWE